VNLFSAMNNLQSFEDLPNDVGYNSLTNIFTIISNEQIKGASVHVLYKHKEGILVEMGEVMTDDVLGPAIVHHRYLYFYLFQEIFVLDRYHSNSELFRWISKAKSLIDLADTSLT